MKVVADASVALKWFLRHHADEQDLTQAGDLAAGIERGTVLLYVPPHWRLEILGVLAQCAPEVIEEALVELAGLAARTVETFEAYEMAGRMSVDLKLHIFDTMYHAVALQSEATLITADERYFAKARELGNIALLSNFELG